jgi:hypothetical protein
LDCLSVLSLLAAVHRLLDLGGSLGRHEIVALLVCARNSENASSIKVVRAQHEHGRYMRTLFLLHDDRRCPQAKEKPGANKHLRASTLV